MFATVGWPVTQVVAVTAAVLGSLVLVAGAAAGQTGPPLTLSTASALPGETVTASGEGCTGLGGEAPRHLYAVVRLFQLRPPGVVIAQGQGDADAGEGGAFSVALRIPAELAPGNCQIAGAVVMQGRAVHPYICPYVGVMGT